MKNTVLIRSLATIAVCMALAISAGAGDGATVTGTVSQVDEYTLVVGSPAVGYTLTTIMSVDPSLVDEGFPQDLQGKNVTITYQTVNGQNLILSVRAVADGQ